MRKYEPYAMSADEVARLGAHMVAEHVIVPALRDLYAKPSYKEGTKLREIEDTECAVDASCRMVDVDMDMFTATVQDAVADGQGELFETFLRMNSFFSGMREHYEEWYGEMKEDGLDD